MWPIKKMTKLNKWRLLLASLPRHAGLEEGAKIVATVGFWLLINYAQIKGWISNLWEPIGLPNLLPSPKHRTHPESLSPVEITAECPLVVAGRQIGQSPERLSWAILISSFQFTSERSHSFSPRERPGLLCEKIPHGQISQKEVRNYREGPEM